MNILPKKRWHVRTKDNIARVRRDEAEAREKEQERLEKLKFAESEARINFLRRQTGLPERQHEEIPSRNNTTTVEESTSQHIDLFADYKTHIKKTNKDLEEEQKEEREKYEKQIGYLTYLGQDTNEALKLRSWYEVAPKRARIACDTETEKDLKNKYSQDPLTLINVLLPVEKGTKTTKDTPKTNTKIEPIDSSEVFCKKNEIPRRSEHKKHKKEKKLKKKKNRKEKHHKRSKERTRSPHKNKKSIKKNLAGTEQKREEQKRDLMNRLRKERLLREAAERDRQDVLLKPPETKTIVDEKKANSTARVFQKYNSQFNPELAKQNML